MLDSAVFLILMVAAQAFLSVVIAMSLRSSHRDERDEEIRAAYRDRPIATRRWLIGEEEELP